RTVLIHALAYRQGRVVIWVWFLWHIVVATALPRQRSGREVLMDSNALLYPVISFLLHLINILFYFLIVELKDNAISHRCYCLSKALVELVLSLIKPIKIFKSKGVLCKRSLSQLLV